ncbi:ATP-binding response regulator [Thiohalocapsa halophila]|uniref:ATP-binding response regulator n=1 Tax=Thiohalocapsa halophila TaxID=69359 RepID=UPI00190308C6|nr:ATP-binding protein [Thiohalocapsa halophila]
MGRLPHQQPIPDFVTARRQDVAEECLRLLHQQIPRGQVLNVSLATIFAGALWLQMQTPRPWIWMAGFLTVVLIRQLLHRFVLPPARGRPIRRTTPLLYTLTAVFSGAGWGSALYILDLGSTDVLVLTALTLGGVMAGAIGVLSYLLSVYVGFILPIALPLALHFFTQEPEGIAVIGLMVLVFLAGCVYFALVFNGVVTQTLRLKYANDALLQDLQRQKQIAEDANVAKSKFLAAASHDLRQPLHALNLLIEALKTSRADRDRADIYPRVGQSLEALGKLFNALLDISKLDAAAVTPEPEDFRLEGLLGRCVREHEAEARRKGLRLRCRDCAVLVQTDPLLLERVVRNLLSNAIRYTKQGGVLIACRKRGNGVLLQVWDTGVGIPEDRIAEVFEEFRQIDNPHRDRNRGLGLGLAIVRRLCNLLGLPLTLRSRLARGTVVSILLPRAIRRQETAASPPSPSPIWEMRGRVVLVIDDERDVLQATAVLLEQWGCEALTAQSGPQAQVLLRRGGQVPDVILSDLRLRDEETGIDAIAAVRAALGQPVPAVLLSGDTAPERIRLARESGYRLLHKPLQPARLRAALQRAIAEIPAR